MITLRITTRLTADGRISVSDGQGTTATYPVPLHVDVTRADYLRAARTYLAEQKGWRRATLREDVNDPDRHDHTFTATREA